jgi:large subunit ribosomal protein L5
MSVKSKDLKELASEDFEKIWEKPMKKPFLEKLVLNIGVGVAGEDLDKASAVLEQISGKKAVKTNSKKNIKEFNLKKGRPIGTKVTLRGEEAEKLLKRLLLVNNNKILRYSFDNRGNFGFGIQEHISIPATEYLTEIGIWGLDVTGRITRPGMRVRYRKKRPSKVAKKHYVTRAEAQYFLQKHFDVQIVQQLDTGII